MDRNTFNEFEHIQDVLGQLTSLKLYTHLALGFAVDEDPFAISQELHRSAEQLTLEFPFLAGHVVRKGSGTGKSGLATVVPYPAGQRPSLVILKDCQNVCPPMKTMLSAGVPMAMLDGEVLGKRKASPYDESMEPAPVLEIQANFIQGGLVMVFQGHHNIMDMNGMGHIVHLYAKALRKEPFTEFEVFQGNQDRRNLVKLLDPKHLSDLTRCTPVVNEKAPAPSEVGAPSLDVRWVYFHFPNDSLARLKIAASKNSGATHTATAPWITTDDALSAWLCQRILIAKLQRLPKAPKATICRAVDARRFLRPPIPKEYTGHAVTCVYTEISLDDPTATNDLSRLAHQMRSDVLDLDSHKIQSFATKLESLDDKGELSYGARVDLAAFDVTLSSWSALGASTAEFGKVLGRPAFAKRPRLFPVESLLFFMPKTLEGHIDVACCLKSTDIDSLRDDVEFCKYSRYIG